MSPLTYIVVNLILIVLTILTDRAFSFVPENGEHHVVIGLIIAVVKASLVVLFFMHAIHSRGNTRAVILVTLFWLVAVMFVLTFIDYTSRGIIPNLPGH